MSFPTYPAYKDSGVEWLGDVPEHWNISPLKFSASCNDTVLPDSTDDDYEIEYVEISDVNEMSGITGSTSYKFADAPSRARRMLQDGDVLVSTVRTYLRAIAPVVAPPENLIASTGFAVVRPRKGILDGAFLGYLLRAEWWISEVIARSVGVSYPAINASDLIGLNVPVPAWHEQTQIARFLDHETARIDALIEEQQRLIELLKEKRQAVISHAVTKGLDPTVPMKDSGVEWLGEVPTHWETNALNKLTVKITNGYVGPTRDILVESGVPYVQATHIKRGVVNFDDTYFVTPEWSMKMSKSILQEGDVLIVQTGAGTGDVGVVSSREVGYNCHALIILRTYKNMLSGVFLSQVLQSRFGQSVLYSIRTGGMHPHLNCGEVKFVKIPAPPLNEQEEISNFVRTFSEQAETLIIEAGATMDLLQERRSALISAAVTGKIDVRGWQPPANAPAPESAQEAV